MRSKNTILGTRKPDSIGEYVCDFCGMLYSAYRCHAERKGKQRFYCSAKCKKQSQVKTTPTTEDLDRFWDKVDKSGGRQSCWIWTAARTTTGYGNMAWPGKRGPYAAHRISFWIANGREAIGMVLHSCDNPICVNPLHLSEGSQSDNMAQASKRGRSARGERNGQALLTEQDVRDIRARYKRRHPIDGGHVIAREYGVSQGAIMSIVNRKSWKHIP